MPKRAKELSALQVKNLNQVGHHAVGGVEGLNLYIQNEAARSWVLRISVKGKRHHLGLGSYPGTSLASARESARAIRAMVLNGHDPITQRREAKQLRSTPETCSNTFKQEAEAFISSRQVEWKNEKHQQQWRNTLETYAYPFIGSLDVKEVTTNNILDILTPIWQSKTETAGRLRQRIEAVLDGCKAKGLRGGDNPARWKGHLDKLLPSPSKLKKTQHHRAMAIDEMPEFFKQLRTQGGSAAGALVLLIYTATRSGEVRGARWNEFDLDSGLWTIPAERMKAGQAHVVPLSSQCIAHLKAVASRHPSSLVIPNAEGKQLSDAAMLQVLKRMQVDAVPHGFRSTFRDWVGDRTDYSRELAEHALAHRNKDKVEAAYRRGTATEKRREMMQAWADFINGC